MNYPKYLIIWTINSANYVWFCTEYSPVKSFIICKDFHNHGNKEHHVGIDVLDTIQPLIKLMSMSTFHEQLRTSFNFSLI